MINIIHITFIIRIIPHIRLSFTNNLNLYCQYNTYSAFAGTFEAGKDYYCVVEFSLTDTAAENTSVNTDNTADTVVLRRKRNV